MTNDCLLISEVIIQECFENELNSTLSSEEEKATTLENIVEPSTVRNYVMNQSKNTLTVNENELEVDEKLVVKIVDLVMNKIASIQTSDDAEIYTEMDSKYDQTSTKMDSKYDQTNHGQVMKSNNQMLHPKINNFIMFNFNVKEKNVIPEMNKD